jgi:hypothetical protein
MIAMIQSMAVEHGAVILLLGIRRGGPEYFGGSEHL